MINTTGDNGPVRITFEKIDDHFMPNAGNVHCAPSCAGRYLADANPAGTVLVVFPLTVPVELDLDSSMLVRVNFFPGWSHHNSCLNAPYHRFWSSQWRPERNIKGDTGKAVGIGCSRPTSRAPHGLGCPMVNRNQNIRFVIHVIPIVLQQIVPVPA